MSGVRKIASEDPVTDQWQLLSQYAYPRNVTEHFRARNIPDVSSEVSEYVAGCVLQGQAYFDAAAIAPLHIRPLLLYYGTTTLSSAMVTLLTGRVPTISNHGMRLVVPTPNGGSMRISESVVKPIDPQNGGLHAFCTIHPGLDLMGSDWSVEELFGSIPDLLSDYEACYPTAEPFVIPLEVVLTRRMPFERVEVQWIAKHFPDATAALSSVEGLSRQYLAPQVTDSFVLLWRKRSSIPEETGIYSISGRKFLQCAHKKGGRSVTPEPLIVIIMTLFALGVLSRYHPGIWTPFVRNDTSGERLVVQKFLNIAQRYVPNLILNYLNGQRILFVNEREGVTDLTLTLSERDIAEIVEQYLREHHPAAGG